jgi:copper chaperone
MVKTITFKIGMTCGGCSGAVKKILSKIEGVSEIDANLDTKLVAVTCEDSVDSAVMLAALNKWGSAANKSVELMWALRKSRISL